MYQGTQDLDFLFSQVLHIKGQLQEKELVWPSWFPLHFLERELSTLCYHQLIKGGEKSPQRSFILLYSQSILKAISLEYSLEGLMDAEAETSILWPPDAKN